MPRTARDLMTTEVETVAPDMSLVDLERAFLERRVTGFPVVEGRSLVGIVSRSDVVRQLSVEQSIGELMADYYRDLGSDDDKPAVPTDVIGRHVGARMESLRVRDVMIPGLIHVAPDDSLAVVAQTLADRRVHRLPVVDGGELVGIITSFDFVRLFAQGRVELS